MAVEVDDHRNHDHTTCHQALGRFLRADLCEPVFQNGDNQDSNERVDDRASSTHETGATNDNCRYGLQFVTQPGIGIGC